jgi:magnesium-transporting ATPase (P-type)
VETKNLDGETNLKHKQANKDVYRLAGDDVEVSKNFNGAVIECDHPNEFIYNFEGFMSMPNGQKIILTPD